MSYTKTTWVDNSAPAIDATNLNKIEQGIYDAHTEKQDTLVSGTNIKTVNSTSLLGSGDVSVQPTLVSGTNIKTINGNSLLGSGNIVIQGGGGGGSTVAYNPTVTSGTELGKINIDGNDNPVYAPPVPTKTSDLTNDSGFLTGVKTINNTSMVGSGNVAVQEVLVSGTNIKTVNGNSLVGSGDVQVSGGATTSAIAVAIPYTDWYTSADMILADITATGVTTTNDVIVTASSTNKELCAKYGVSVKEQLSGSLRFRAKSLPSENIIVRVLIIS